MHKSSSENVISVVTVVLNDVNHIETTIQSVLSQVNCVIEYIVIDGGSTDGTLGVIEKYRDRIHYFLTEKDDGIYHAMNKAIDVATGRWMIFINSGDTFSCPTVVSDVLHTKYSYADVIYGQYIVNYWNYAERKVIAGKRTDLWKGNFTSHQAMFVRTTLMKAYHFNCEFKSAADYELVAKLSTIGYNFLYVPEVIAVISAGGMSDTRRFVAFSEYTKISTQYFPRKSSRICFLLKYVDLYFRSLAKKILPSHIVNKIYLAKCHRSIRGFRTVRLEKCSNRNSLYTVHKNSTLPYFLVDKD
jgi:glycosyltransferase involved in cell wall biosynthesis